MIDYKTIKKQLQDAGESTKHFTIDFFNTFISERNQASEYEEDKELYTQTKQSKFYCLNGAAYCIFLELFYHALNEYEILFYSREYNSNIIIDKITERFLSREEAARCAKQMHPENWAEITRV